MRGPKINRREFVALSATAGASLALGQTAKPSTSATKPAAPADKSAGAPAVITSKPALPKIISSANGHQFKNGGAQTAIERAFQLMTSGTDPLDAVIAGLNIVELDPEETSVGYGGLPNADGVVQLDSSCMHGPRRRAGAVACIEGVRTPSLVAKAVLESTDHHLIVGLDAQRFARNMGFAIESDLNTPKSRKLWLEWKRRTDPDHYPDPDKRGAAGAAARDTMIAEGLIDPLHAYGTINMNAIDAQGRIVGCTTTSGLAFKIPGRVGDSPILGAGLYVDQDVGAAGSTGRGEANLYNLSSFLLVELMRAGKHPKDAAVEVLRRIHAHAEKRLLDQTGRPRFNVHFYTLNGRGEHACVALYDAGSKYALATESGAELLPCEGVFAGQPPA